ncbi:MAG: hypothetical protein DDT40_00562 [candidate division WS2 bacterium]|uniref:4Fe-4S ferredoxin-type domain-containing protein n=1 Tax=Psychracetigena formicireducens TaxID=2986056 RepID=A0A9E2F6B3_PSYF1|nr:hypothetical protein [Candidatus Psychracetigena formicireducens]MBT9144418.1 hypothetical protein [Candidatus Psychracetigena formicireducens]MBT9150390.1 hypothetical protein [Candidatus Psychracetigena formicireducens]
MEINIEIINFELREAIEERSNQKLINCYQCGKCSAGCPSVHLMDVSPHEIVRMLQLGLIDDVFKVNSPWYCTSCFTCVSRCPRAIDIAKIMEALRYYNLNAAVHLFDPNTLSDEVKDKIPQQALVSLWRKRT